MDSLKLGLEAVYARLAERPTATLVSAGAVYVVFLAYHLGETRKIKHIPAIGSGSAVMSFVGAVQYLMDAPAFVANGLSKAQARVVKIPNLLNWVVLVTGRDLVEDMRKAPDHLLDMNHATDESLQIQYTMAPEISTNAYHHDIVRNQLKRATPQLVPVVYDELAVSFEQYIGASADGWTEVCARDVLLKVVCRASNRVFVGLPLCRDEDYMDLNVNYILDVVKTSAIIRMFPTFLRPLLGWLLPTISKRRQQGVNHIAPLIRSRKQQMELLGDEWEEKPVDFLQWLIEEAEGDETTERALTLRIMVLNFAAIHTSTMTFSQVLYDLAAHPEYQDTLCEEARVAMEQNGVSKVAVDQMVKIDSFIKESQRMRPMGSVMMNRYVMEDYTLPNGVTVPRGCHIGVDVVGMHRMYDNPDEFDPWRFCKIKEETGKRSDITTTTPEFLAFGHGRHACPGRFFAAVEMKLMLAYLVLHYEVRCEEVGVRPKDSWFGPNCVPNPTAKVLFKKRVHSS